MKDRAAATLVAASRLLQTQCWPSGRKKIERQEGESYPAAVKRVILTEATHEERLYLKQLTKWVRDFEVHEVSAH